MIDKKAKWLLISRCDINQIFYSDLYLILFSSGYLISGLLSLEGIS